MTTLKRCVQIFAIAWTLSPVVASALPDYPDYLASAAKTPCLPHCNVCHRDDNAGSGTVDRPFGISMETVGYLSGGGRSDVTSAVDELRSQGTDSDGDGVPDIEELSLGDDPNWAGPGSICGPQVGCAAQRHATAPSWLPALLVSCALLSARWRARARGSNVRP